MSSLRNVTLIMMCMLFVSGCDSWPIRLNVEPKSPIVKSETIVFDIRCTEQAGPFFPFDSRNFLKIQVLLKNKSKDLISFNPSEIIEVENKDLKNKSNKDLMSVDGIQRESDVDQVTLQMNDLFQNVYTFSGKRVGNGTLGSIKFKIQNMRQGGSKLPAEEFECR